MKKLVLFFPLLWVVLSLSTSCKFAPSSDLGDTVAASVFEPEDTALTHKNLSKNVSKTVDSADIFVIGEGSTRQFLQLISYPSRRDTMTYAKHRPLKVKGSAQFGRIVRIGFMFGKDSVKLVKTVEEVQVDSLETKKSHAHHAGSDANNISMSRGKAY